MKFTLRDPEFAGFVGRLANNLELSNFRHMFVGGVATQLHAASMMSKVYGGNFYDLALGEDFSESFRPTANVDIALLNPHPASFLEHVVNDLEGLSDFPVSGDEVVSIERTNRSFQNPRFAIAFDELVDPSSDRQVRINFYYSVSDLKDSSFKPFSESDYTGVFRRSKLVNVPYSGNIQISTHVPALEDQMYLVAAHNDLEDLRVLRDSARDGGVEIDGSIPRKVLRAPRYEEGGDSWQDARLVEVHDTLANYGVVDPISKN